MPGDGPLLLPGYPSQMLKDTARALLQSDYVLPECSLRDSNYCLADDSDMVEEVPHDTFEVTDCLTSGTYYNSWAENQINSRFASSTDYSQLMVCTVEHNGDTVYGVYDSSASNPVVYPSCVGVWNYCGATDTDLSGVQCPGAQTVSAYWNEFFYYVVERKNYMHKQCASIQAACGDGSLNTYEKQGFTGYLYNAGVAITRDGFDDQEVWNANLCKGTDNSIRVVTPDGIINTCVGYLWSGQSNMDANSCPAKRNHVCGTTKGSLAGEYKRIYGWQKAQFNLVNAALTQSDFVYAECPYTSCRSC